MHIDEVSKVISVFKLNAGDVLKLIEKSQTAHGQSNVVAKILLFPFSFIPVLLKETKLVKGTIALQTFIVGILVSLGFPISQQNLPFWSYLTLFIFWYLITTLYGVFAMKRLSTENPFFFYKVFMMFEPALYKAFEKLAEEAESFDRLNDELNNLKLKLELYQGREISTILQNIADNSNNEVKYLKEKMFTEHKIQNEIFQKYSKSVQSCLEGNTSFEDINLAPSTYLLYKETDLGFERKADTTSKTTVKIYEKNFFKDYPYVREIDHDKIDYSIFDNNNEEETYTYIVMASGCKWVITFFNQNNNINAEFFVGYMVPEERIMFLIKKVLENLK